MTKQSALDAARSRWKLVVGMAIFGAVLGALPSPAKIAANSSVTSWVATNTMLSTRFADPSSSGAAPDGVAAAQFTLYATTGEVPARVAAKVDWTGSPAELAGTVQVSFDLDTGALRFRTSQPTAQMAVDIANGFASETAAYLAEQELELTTKSLARWATKVTELKAELEEKQRIVDADVNNVAAVAERDAIQGQYQMAFEQQAKLSASRSDEPLKPLETAEAFPVVAGGLSAPSSRLIRGVLGGLVGLTLGLGSSVVLGRIDRRLRSREQAEEVTGLRVRVEVPTVRDDTRLGRVLDSHHHDALSDAYRTVRNVVGFVHGTLPGVDRARVTLIVSPGPGEGKTTLTTNLAASFAEIGMRTVAVNTDFRRPKLADRLCGTDRVPLPWELDDLGWVPPQRVLRDTPTPNLSVFDLGAIGPAGELARRTAAMIPQLAREVDAIVVDSSPVSATAEVLELVPLADVIVVVVRLGETSIAAAESTVSILRDLTTAPLLLVVVGGSSAGRGDGYGYGYGYEEQSDRSRRTGKSGRDGDGTENSPASRWQRRDRYEERAPVPPPLPVELPGLDDLLAVPPSPGEPAG